MSSGPDLELAFGGFGGFWIHRLGISILHLPGLLGFHLGQRVATAFKSVRISISVCVCVTSRL